MRRYTLAIVLVGFSIVTLYAQDVNHYVIVGAFGVKANATRLASLAGRSSLNARVEFNTTKKLYYVYLIESGNSDEVYTYVTKVRVETPFKDAWVYHGILGNRPVLASAAPPPVVKPEVKEEIKPVVSEPEKTAVVATTTTAVTISEPPPVIKSDPVPAKPPGKAFFFKLVNEQTGNPVEGEVHVLESPKSQEYIAYESNKIIYLPAPKNTSGTYQLTTFAPGYKPSKRALSYSDPANSAASKGTDDEFIIAIPLVRVKSGDYIEFNNVKFYSNSTILQPESRNELRGLAGLMKENLSYRIVIHGHCNGNEDRDVTLLGSSTNLFQTTSENVKERSDAKTFTLLRAETVKAFLVEEGVDESRIKTKGEGGKEYIYPANSTLSARNDRVEVQVTKGR
jgi:outer membrane protein OmpA-like peptidoglycan-associated protein